MLTFSPNLFPFSVNHQWFSVNLPWFSRYLFLPVSRSSSAFQIFCKGTKLPQHSQKIFINKKSIGFAPLLLTYRSPFA